MLIKLDLTFEKASPDPILVEQFPERQLMGNEGLHAGTLGFCDLILPCGASVSSLGLSHGRGQDSKAPSSKATRRDLCPLPYLPPPPNPHHYQLLALCR